MARGLAGLLLLLSSLLTMIWLAPGFPYPEQDSAWVLALNQAVAERLRFGRDVIYPLGPWGAVYAGQYHPATDAMMLVGGALVAVALASGLAALARNGRRWVVLLAPMLVATVGLHDPVFVATPLLLLAVAVALAERAPRVAAMPRDGLGAAALMLLTASCALLTFVKSTFGTQAMPMVGLSLVALAAGRRLVLAGCSLALYLAAFIGFWLAAGQRLADLPTYLGTAPLLISGYIEGAAVDGPWTDIAAYVLASAVLLWLFWRDRSLRGPSGNLLLLAGLLFTLFVAFKAGFVRHDEHALIALGSLALLPVVLVRALRFRSFALGLAVTLCALAYVSRHYAGYQWPSWARGRDRLVSAAVGAWSRVADPSRLARGFDADMAGLRAAMPLQLVTGPTDIYSSGQAILLANGLEWSPRPALQSVTVYSARLAQADLNHLQGEGGNQPPVQNVFYRVENEDNRLRSTQDGLSWPALLSAFSVHGYDRALDMALLQRRPGVPAAQPSGPSLLEGRFRFDQQVPLPAAPESLLWATLDIQPTLAGRLASLLFRPPILYIVIRYQDGPVETFRLLTGLARAAFLLTPRVIDTEDMLWMLLPERRAPLYQPVSISIVGERGSRWLWRQSYDLRLRSAGIPTQSLVRPMLLATPAPQPPEPSRATDTTAACSIDFIDGRRVSATPLEAIGSTRVTGWSLTSPPNAEVPDQVLVRITDAAGRSWEAPAQRHTARPDVAAVFGKPGLSGAGFDAAIDLSSLSGAYTLTTEAARGGRRWLCKTSQSLHVEPLPSLGSPPDN